MSQSSDEVSETESETETEASSRPSARLEGQAASAREDNSKNPDDATNLNKG